MSVTGYLALYTTLLGWQQYQNLWSLAVGTGLIYLPFIGIVLSTTVEPFTSMGAKDAAQIAIRRMTLQILATFLIIIFAAEPFIDLDPKVLHFEPLCQSTDQTATPGNTGTTYDNAFPVPTGVKVPIFWYLVMSFANGITHAASVGLPCSPIDYRTLHTQLDTAKIQDPQLKKEVEDFDTHCYQPVYSAYMGNQLSPATQAQIQQSLQQNGQADVKWLGSQTFLNIAGLYDAQKAGSPITGFAFDPNRDQIEGQVNNHSPWGEPDCKTWWTDPQNGLYTRLKQALPPTFWQQITNLGGDQQQLQDATIKTFLTHNTPSHQSTADEVRGYESINDNLSGDVLSRFIGAPLGVGYESLSYYPKLHLLINALPVVQGLLLFAVYAFLGLAIPFSRYRIGFCITGAIIVFSLIFCSYLWNVVAWLDNYLIQALYPSLGDVLGAGGILDAIDTGNTNKILVDMIIGCLYVGLPLIWMGVMGWAGYQIGAHVSGAYSALFSPPNQAGEKSGSRVSRYLP